MVKMLTVLVSTISNSQVFLLKNVSSFCKCKSYLHLFSKNVSIYAIFDDHNFNDMISNDIASFEQLGPVLFSRKVCLIWSCDQGCGNTLPDLSSLSQFSEDK